MSIIYTAKNSRVATRLDTLQQTCYQQAVIWMRSRGLRQLVDDEFVLDDKWSTDLLQVDCQNFLSTGLLQVVSTSCNKSGNDKFQQA